MPIDEAERVISKYTPTVKEQQGIPSALEELRTDRVQDKRGLEEALKIDRTCALCCSCYGWCPLTNKRELPKGRLYNELCKREKYRRKA